MSGMLLIALAVFIGVASLVGAIAVIFRDQEGSSIENRLDLLTGATVPEVESEHQEGVLSKPFDATGPLDALLRRFANLELLIEQADSGITANQLAMVSGGLALGTAVLGLFVGVPMVLGIVLAPIAAVLPIFWLILKRRRRWKSFAFQLPDALEMLSRALRAGQSLGAGFSMIAAEMSDPIAQEFGRAFEEQNLGVKLEDSLREMAQRIPNLDLQFFVTAVILQRTTGGDLAEILDKIGHLVRERFQIYGAVQALTGEGRLSGAVLLALPPTLLGVVYYLNPDYITVLFTDPIGQKLLIVTVILQVLGALVIRKIINIKV